MGLFSLFRRPPHERSGFLLYGQAVATARHGWFYRDPAEPATRGLGVPDTRGLGVPDTRGLGVPDTLDGRFDVVGLHAILLIQRLRSDPDKEGAKLAQAVFDAMFADMDQNLRQMGVGDLSVGKKVKDMWNAFHGRAQAYEPALTACAPAALAVALQRNIWRDEAAEPTPAAARLAAHALACAAALGAQPLAALVAGQVRFPAPPEEDADAA